MCIDIGMILLGIITCHFPQICTIVTALDLCQIFFSAQYLENKNGPSFDIVLFYFIFFFGLLKGGMIQMPLLSGHYRPAAKCHLAF